MSITYCSHFLDNCIFPKNRSIACPPFEKRLPLSLTLIYGNVIFNATRVKDSVPGVNFSACNLILAHMNSSLCGGCHEL